MKGKGEALSVSGGGREFSHKQVRIKQENNKHDLDNSSPDGRQLLASSGLVNLVNHGE